MTGVKVKDATGGFKAFRQSVLRSIDFSQIRCAGFGFQAEINHACERMGCVVTEHPIVFIDRTMGKSKMSLGIMIEAMWKLLPLRWKSGALTENRPGLRGEKYACGGRDESCISSTTNY